MAPASTNVNRYGAPPTPSASQSGTQGGRMSPLNSSSVARHGLNATASSSTNRECDQSSVAMPMSHEEVVRQWLKTIKSTLESVGQTLEMVGETTEHVAGLTPAMEMAKQVGEVTQDLQAHKKRQDEAMEKLKEYLKNVAKENVEGHLAKAVEQVIKEEIRRQIGEKVAEQLQAQIPEALRRQAESHGANLTNSRVRLHNAEARRLNSVPKISTSDPLRPLLRRNGAESTYFPYDLSTLFVMSPRNVKLLVRDFELSNNTTGQVHGNTVPRIMIGDEEEERVENLNRFMQHIGVPIEVIPGRPTPGNQSAVPPSPIFVQSH